MGEQENRATVERVIQALNERDLDLFDAQFHDDSLVEYPQSGERIVGGENRRAVYSAFPGLPTVSPRRLTVSGDLAVAEAQLDYGDGTDYRCVFIFELREGKIARETAYWAQPFAAADWRAPWVEMTNGDPTAAARGS
jgi:ketosteroid isomerase-like protein